ncbi:hypothetical protein MJO28_011690 [Puccinia striiformis f. sp. tritici]|uniref:Uncharacterized protein n=1 Tax=Puccinia striiformis f. sp. tritici TaxID=168172 RepID=A0ACC0E3C3_9BASI|nr:hypothetical protein MJO28_011690 [Puccinia striiformis f. sp. tritici]
MPPNNRNGSRTDRDGWSKDFDGMEVVDSSNPSTHPGSQTPTQADYSKNPPLSQSQHNPETGFLKIITEIFSKPNNDGSVYIPAEKVKTLSPLLDIENFTSLRTLSMVEQITDRLDSFEKSLKSISHPKPSLPSSAMSWASATKKVNPPHILSHTPTRAPPSNRVLNEFKPAFFIIRKTVPDSNLFFQKSPKEITQIVNDVLADIGAKTDDGKPITIRGTARLPSGDFKFFTHTRFAANWLRENKHEWTSKCDPTLITPPSNFQVILHSVPISFTPSNRASISDLCRENSIDSNVVQSIRWLGHPVEDSKSHGSVVMNLRDKDLANKIAKGHLFYNCLPLIGAQYKRSPLQCFKCLDIGHTAQLCKNNPLCKFCGDGHNSNECESDKNRCPMSYNLPPISPDIDQSTSSSGSSTSSNSINSSSSVFKILQLNCHNGFDVTHNALNSDSNFSVLILQEPWVNPKTYKLPHYVNWTSILDQNHSPIDYNDKHRTCFFISKSFNSSNIHPLPDGSRILSAVDLDLDNEKIKKLRLINLYNPPRTFEGIEVLDKWLNSHNNRHIPSFICMDSNLHHRIWNPSNYRHTHRQAKDLIKVCGKNGFKIISEKGNPTFLNKRTSSTVIDLTWANFAALKFVDSCSTSSSNFSSDHQSIRLHLNFSPNFQPDIRLSFDIKNLDIDKLCVDLSKSLKKFADSQLSNTDEIDDFVFKLTNSFQNSVNCQKKVVKNNSTKIKPWWNKEILSPIIKNRNQARKWMLIAHSVQACDCYQQWQKKFKEKVFELKRDHWRKFLAESKDHQIFKAYKFTKPSNNGSVAPLLNENDELTSNKEEQARLLFKGTSQVPINCDLDDIQPHSFPNSLSFPDISAIEVDNIISILPKKKACGHNDITNETLSWSKNILLKPLTHLFNACLRLGYFPKFWRHAITVIIRKADKESYAVPGAYRPIALLSCLGKMFESLLTKRITYWAENNDIIAHGHFGGRASRCTDDVNLFLTSWIRKKWQEKKVVSALFLDVKSAYPSVIKERLIDTLIKHDIPSYLAAIIQSLLSDRSTSLRMDDYLSPSFDLHCGLPQGSPLSPILYIIYNSDLLINNSLDLKQNKISLGFIDDVTHFVAEKHLEDGIRELEEEGNRSLRWGKKNNTIFDKKKANFMIFTCRSVNIRPLNFGDLLLHHSKSVKYLGIILDPRLSFRLHLKKVEKCGKNTSEQLSRISRCSFGVGLQQSKNLIISVLRSRVLYGSIIWASKRNEATVKKIISIIENQANRIILGVFKTTPCAVLNRETPLIPFFDILKRKNHLYVGKKLTTPNQHPINRLIKSEINKCPSNHRSSIHNLFDSHLFPEYDLQALETIHHHLFPPWKGFLLNIQKLHIKKEIIKNIVNNQIGEKKSKNENLLFTDGSNIPNKGAALAALLNNSFVFSCRINDADEASAFEAEVQAINIGLELLKNEFVKNNLPFSNQINIYSDNQATLLSSSKLPLPKSFQSVFVQIFEKMDFLMNACQFSIKLYWCPAHVGIAENEKVDELAKLATEGDHRFQLEKQKRSLSNIQQIIKSKFTFDKIKKPII